ncbi:ketopantoate reductase family protein [Arthrobacter cryoconiti]|uniref:Ketopantoate reductase family protein n=1 Tax=Arthrobacter cryoconiti TaxID=748907 RepID=A0ABV8QYZ0_9MICC|nr:2-dehydropantoate 2-reductase N-terminal domain-containing protein [Arthrobacter cryoconiti]MCC9069532.1 hypothetical protein [Arthrobacter cryoconiti]
MKILVYGAGVIGSLFAVRLHEAGYDVSLLARGERLDSLRKHGVQLAESDSPDIRRVMVPVVADPAGGYDLNFVFVRAQHIGQVLKSLHGLTGDVVFMLNWAAGPLPLGEGIGPERVLLGFPTEGGTMDGQVIRFVPKSFLTRMVSMPIGEPDGQNTPRLERILQLLRAAGLKAKSEPQMDAWLKTHAAFEVPLGQMVHAAGGLEALAGNPDAIRGMLRVMRVNLASMPTQPTPRIFNALRIIPEVVLVALFRKFLHSSAAAPLGTESLAASAENQLLADQIIANATPCEDSPKPFWRTIC